MSTVVGHSNRLYNLRQRMGRGISQPNAIRKEIISPLNLYTKVLLYNVGQGKDFMVLITM